MVSTTMSDAVALRHQRHILRLQIGSESWILLGSHIDGSHLTVPTDAQRIRTRLCHIDAGLLQLRHERIQMSGLAASHRQVAARDRAGDHESAGLNAVAE